MGLFSRAQGSATAVIDITADSVGGGYVYQVAGNTPQLCYGTRLPIETREGESQLDGMLRTLAAVNEQMITQGAPRLREVAGSGGVTQVWVHVPPPWQDTSIRIETVQPTKPFTFTTALAGELLEGGPTPPEGRVRSGDTILATILNGYDIANPFGKRVSTAEVTILSSTIHEAAKESIEKVVRKAFHTSHIRLGAFPPIAYHVLHKLFPHERDFLILSVEGNSTSLAFTKHGVLVEVLESDHGISELLSAGRLAGHDSPVVIDRAEMLSRQPGYLHPERAASFETKSKQARDEWLGTLTDSLKTIAAHHALPRTIFLITSDEARGYLKRALDSSSIHTLWLSDEPLSVIPLSALQFSQKLVRAPGVDGDTTLAMLALYATLVGNE